MIRDDLPIPAAARPLFGIALKITSVVVFVGMQSLLKATDGAFPPGQLVFFRSFFALLPVALWLLWLGEFGTALKTDDLPGQMVRGIVGVSAMSLGFFALGELPYGQWIALSYAAPLLSVVFAVVFLGEVVRLYRWAAVAIGLFGILVVAVPGFGGPESGIAPIGVLAAVGGATFSAIAMIQVRRLVQREKAATIVVYFSLTCSLLSLATLPFGWVWPSPMALLLLVSAGLCGGIGQLLMTECYRHADTSTIAPFEYTSLVLAVLIGYAVFEEAVSLTTVAGGAIVVSAGLFIIFREHRLGLERAKARKVTPPQS